MQRYGLALPAGYAWQDKRARRFVCRAAPKRGGGKGRKRGRARPQRSPEERFERLRGFEGIGASSLLVGAGFRRRLCGLTLYVQPQSSTRICTNNCDVQPGVSKAVSATRYATQLGREPAAYGVVVVVG